MSTIKSAITFLHANNAWVYVWHNQIIPVTHMDGEGDSRFWEHRQDLVDTLEFRGLTVGRDGVVESPGDVTIEHSSMFDLVVSQIHHIDHYIDNHHTYGFHVVLPAHHNLYISVQWGTGNYCKNRGAHTNPNPYCEDAEVAMFDGATGKLVGIPGHTTDDVLGWTDAATIVAIIENAAK